jgi:hypothetical protein
MVWFKLTKEIFLVMLWVKPLNLASKSATNDISGSQYLNIFPGKDTRGPSHTQNERLCRLIGITLVLFWLMSLRDTSLFDYFVVCIAS